jgi:hypothetical protein
MSIFSLHSCVAGDYRDFVRSFFAVADDRAREFIDDALPDVGKCKWQFSLFALFIDRSRVELESVAVTRKSRQAHVLWESLRSDKNCV